MRPRRGNEVSGAGRVVALVALGMWLGACCWAARQVAGASRGPTTVNCTDTPNPDACLRDHGFWLIQDPPLAPRCLNRNGRVCI